MPDSSNFAAYLKMLTPEQMQEALAHFLPAAATTAEKTVLVEAALRSPQGKALREELGRWIVDKLVPVERLLPARFAAWRGPTRESMLFVISRLSVERLAPKLVEQLELPIKTAPEVRLLKLITRVPGLQKLGQVLARNRHLRHSVRMALSKLENGIRDVDIDDVIALARRELGKNLETYGVKIEHALLSEASVSAVVRFTWWNEQSKRREKGVFKVLKPHIPQCFAEDMKILQDLANFFGRRTYEGFAPAAIPDTFRKIRQHLQREVDFPGEQRALLEAAKQFTLRGVRVPKLIPQFCTTRLTAMSEEAGVKVTSAAVHLTAKRRMQLAQQMVEALVAFPLLSRQTSALFHADPHAGNLLYDRETGELVILDWALAERLDREQRRRLALLFLAVGMRNAAAAAHHMEGLCEGQPVETGRAEHIDKTVRQFMARLPLAQFPRAVDAMELLEAVALTGIRFPSSLIMFSKVLFTLDGILDDIRGNGATAEFTIARYLVKRWMRQPLTLGLPLTVRDWIGVECSALLYGGKLGVHCEEVLAGRLLRSQAGAADLQAAAVHS